MARRRHGTGAGHGRRPATRPPPGRRRRRRGDGPGGPERSRRRRTAGGSRRRRPARDRGRVGERRDRCASASTTAARCNAGGPCPARCATPTADRSLPPRRSRPSGSPGPAGRALADDLTAAPSTARPCAGARRPRTDPRGHGTPGRRALGRDPRPALPPDGAGGQRVDRRRGPSTFGPMRAAPMPCAWVAVARDHLRLGPDAASARLHEHVLPPADDLDRQRLADAIARAGVSDASPPAAARAPLAARSRARPRVRHRDQRQASSSPSRPSSVACTRRRRSAPSSSPTPPGTHLKLPLGVATLGATRLLPPRYLDNGDRAERVLRDRRGPRSDAHGAGGRLRRGALGRLERRHRRVRRPPGSPRGAGAPVPGRHHLRRDRGPPDGRARRGGGLGRARSGRWASPTPWRSSAGSPRRSASMAVGFLAHGVLPEIHGQNVVVRLAPGGAVAGFVLRDHDTLRIHPPWMDAAGRGRPGLPDPAGRPAVVASRHSPRTSSATRRPSASRSPSSRSPTPSGRRHGLPERAFWERMRARDRERARAATGSAPTSWTWSDASSWRRRPGRAGPSSARCSRRDAPTP